MVEVRYGIIIKKVLPVPFIFFFSHDIVICDCRIKKEVVWESLLKR